MPGMVRHSDLTIGFGSHGNLECPHLIVGVFVSGSPNVSTNNLQSVRAFQDFGAHTCPHCAVNMPIGGSPNVLTNNMPAHRIGDLVTEFCGVGITVTGSANVIVN